MKVRIKDYVPVGKEHGITKGRVFNVLERSDSRGIWVVGDAGEPVKVLPREYEVEDDHLTGVAGRLIEDEICRLMVDLGVYPSDALVTAVRKGTQASGADVVTLILALQSALNAYRCPLRDCSQECWSYLPGSRSEKVHQLAVSLQDFRDTIKEAVYSSITYWLERLDQIFKT